MAGRSLRIATTIAVLLVALTLVAVVGGGLAYASRFGGSAPSANMAAQVDDEQPEAEEPEANEEPGLVVVHVEQDGAAAAAGVARGDILLRVAGQDVNTVPELHAVLDEHQPGDAVELQVQHGDEARTLTATLGERGGRAYLELIPFGGPIHDTIVIHGAPGAVVREVAEGSPAEQAGLQEGDVISSVNGQELDGETTLGEALDGLAPGDSVALEIQRPGEDGMETLEVNATLGENPDEAGEAYLGVTVWDFPGHIFEATEGMPFTFGVEPMDRLFPTMPGLVVSEVVEGSPAEQAGLQAGDVVSSADGEALHGPRALEEVLASHAPGDSLTLEVQRYSEEGEEPETLTLTALLGENLDEAGEPYLGIRYGMGPRLWVGEGALPLLPSIGIAPHFNLPDGETLQGAIIGAVVEGSPAAAAGLQEGDLITAVNGEALESPETFEEAIGGRAPGETVTLTVTRPGETDEAEAQPQEVQVALGENPDEPGRGYLGISAGFFIQVESSTVPALPGSEGGPMPGFRLPFAPGGEGEMQIMPAPGMPEFDAPWLEENEAPVGDSV
jgi:S1-C subfamily serine protease